MSDVRLSNVRHWMCRAEVDGVDGVASDPGGLFSVEVLALLGSLHYMSLCGWLCGLASILSLMEIYRRISRLYRKIWLNGESITSRKSPPQIYKDSHEIETLTIIFRK